MFAIFPILQTWNFLPTEIFCNFFIPFESLEGKREKIAKIYFCDHTTLEKIAFKFTLEKFLLLQYSLWFAHQLFHSGKSETFILEQDIAYVEWLSRF